MKLLDFVSWGKPAIKFLSYLNNHKGGFPINVMLRHSAREEQKKLVEIFKATLTQQGKDAAFEFGKALTIDRNYRFFHSPIHRCEETAEYIKKGIQDNDGNTQLLGGVLSLLQIKSTKNKFIFYRDRDKGDFMKNWLNGVYPAEEIENTIDVAQRIVHDMMKNLKTIKPNTIDIYITHDSHLMILIYYLVGIQAIKGWPQYLDGLILQFKDGMLVIYYNGEILEVKYPNWLRNLISKE